jgi:hypothetical protein
MPRQRCSLFALVAASVVMLLWRLDLIIEMWGLKQAEARRQLPVKSFSFVVSCMHTDVKIFGSALQAN